MTRSISAVPALAVLLTATLALAAAPADAAKATHKKAPAKTTNSAPAKSHARSGPKKATPKPKPMPPPPPPLPEAGSKQREAAAMALYGNYDCEFNQSLAVELDRQHDGYVGVRFGKQGWTMKPVLSSTGALRLEDVDGRMLLLQIANKSMLMDIETGRRVVDDCVNEGQRAAHDRPQAKLGIGPSIQIKLRLLETSDVHMNLLGYDYYQDKASAEYGLDRTITLLKAARAEAPNSLTFDNGDLLQGSPLGDYVARTRPLAPGEVHPAFKVLNALGVDAANLGNHEFDYGLPFLRRAIAGATFPYVNANVYVEDGDADPSNDSNAFTPYVMLERTFKDEQGGQQKLKIGVVGFVPPQVMLWDRAMLRGQVNVHDIVETANHFVPEMKAKGADIVVAVAHSGLARGGLPRYAENAVARLAEVRGIDAILFGHSHGEFPGPGFADYPKVDVAKGTVNGVAAVMAGHSGSHLGVVDLVLDNATGGWLVRDSHAEVRPVYDRTAHQPLAEPDPMVASAIAAEHAGTLTSMRSVITQTRTPISSYFAQVADDASVQLVAQSQRAYAKRALKGTPYEKLPLLSAAAPFKTGGRQGGGAYTDIPAGPVALRNVADLYVYPNTVNAVQLSGAQVREWLEMSAGAFNRIDPAGAAQQELLNPAFAGFNFDTLEGVTYRIDVTQPARYDPSGKLAAPTAHRIVDLRYDGQPIVATARFIVVTNSYRAAGGGNFPALDGTTTVLDAPDDSRSALIDYLKATPLVDAQPDGNWRIQPVPGIRLRFTSGAGGITRLAQQPNVALVKDNGDGSASYELKP